MIVFDVVLENGRVGSAEGTVAAKKDAQFTRRSSIGIYPQA